MHTLDARVWQPFLSLSSRPTGCYFSPLKSRYGKEIVYVMCAVHVFCVGCLPWHTILTLLLPPPPLQAGDNVLVHAGASSVGQCLIQMASRKGARVVATTRSEGKVEVCMKRGAAEVIVLPNANFTHKALSVGIKDWSSVDQYRYYQCVFDPVGKFVSV